MSRTGRPPKPTRLKLIQGNPGKRAVNKDEPKPDLTTRVRVPAHLSKVAKAEYRKTAKLLMSMGVLTEADHRMLELYAEQYAIWTMATAKLHDEDAPGELGELIEKLPSGYESPKGYLAIAERASKRLQSLLTEFGMSPVSRTRVTAEKPKGNEFDEL